MTAPADVLRRKHLGIAAAIALLATAALGFAAPAATTGAPGPLGRPHVEAGVTCAACHGAATDVPAPGKACIGCHGAHPSSRSAHRELASEGALACPTCHKAHGGGEGVSFDGEGRGLRWLGDDVTRSEVAGPSGATVTLVPLTACARCHDLASASDPVHACVASSPSAPYDTCFDEHQTPSHPLPSRGACAHQHGPARFTAWDATRAVLLSAPPPAQRTPLLPWLWVASSVSAGGIGFVALARARRRRPLRRPAPSSAPSPSPALVRLPLIDASRCLGCHACVEACPFDALAVDKHVAVLARPGECCGVGACEAACPNGSLTLAEEGEVPPDRPRVDARLESQDRRGVFLAGDLTGVPLIRNAIAQGTLAVEHAAADLRRARAPRPKEAHVDVAIVGAGPAGLAAALRAKELGLTCLVLEQSTIAATLRSFPRGKVVHDPPIDLPLEGPLWLRESTKEELLAQWTRLVRLHRLDVLENHRVVGLEGEAGDFRVRAERPSGPAVVRALRVVFAIGRRGTPRPLDTEVAPSAEGKVVYALSDARSLAGKSVLVVGLGDAAMEAIVAVARQPGSVVTVSYRGAAFSRGRAKNIDAVRRLAESGRVRLVFESTVARVDAEGAVLHAKGVSKAGIRVPAEVVLALLGGEPSRALLEGAGIHVRKT